ncbi:MAG: MFS transporter [Ktedonobacteraceae bacterium]
MGWLPPSAGSLLVPGSIFIIGASFDDEQRGPTIGTWVAFTMLVEAIAPVVGGFVVLHASWRWVFFIYAPVAVLALLITFRHVPESRDDSASRCLDWPGAGLVTLGLGGVVYGLIAAGSSGLGNPIALLSLGGGFVALLLFLLVEAAVQLQCCRSHSSARAFSGTNLLTLLLYAGLNGALYFLPFNRYFRPKKQSFMIQSTVSHCVQDEPEG